ncbi:hypothetical protein CC2G_001939 [Coprinopsis cinerea AmutBmut pab1-1]|nr:hypothetical protein CC2G_001939 [Coprinopsis cinerea AmutBmut pab1-1]
MVRRESGAQRGRVVLFSGHYSGEISNGLGKYDHPTSEDSSNVWRRQTDLRFVLSFSFMHGVTYVLPRTRA